MVARQNPVSEQDATVPRMPVVDSLDETSAVVSLPAVYRVTCAEFEAVMPPGIAKRWKTVARVPFWWCWAWSLRDSVEQQEFMNSGFRSPLPRQHRLISIDCEEIFAQQYVGTTENLVEFL